jgi:hypothetical protein
VAVFDGCQRDLMLREIYVTLSRKSKFVQNRTKISESLREGPVFYIISGYINLPGHAVAQLLRHCATNRKVAGSIFDGVIGIVH